MAKIKLTRNELKAQREALARYARFLPTLELKKMQLETERQKIVKEKENLQEEMNQFQKNLSQWQGLFCESFPKPVYEFVHIQEVITVETNIAGIFIPMFKEIVFQIDDYDKFLTPVWFDTGVKTVEDILRLRERLKILENQEQIVLNELRRTTQRINLFKERLIPQCKENIRQIRIYLGDVQAAAVGRAKIAKQKMQRA